MKQMINLAPPRPTELFKQGPQNARLYERLLRGPVTNIEVVRDMCILKYTGRISDVRKALRPCLMDVKAVRMQEPGQWLYQLRG